MISVGSASQGPLGVCLLYMGGPRTLAEVQPFLQQLFSDRELIRLPGGPWLQRRLARWIATRRAPRTQRYYTEIGGGSPLARITTRQAELLEESLALQGNYKVAVAMRYCTPRAEEAVQKLEAAGIRRCVALPLYPQFSRATSGSSFHDFSRACQKTGVTWPVTRIESYHDHPLYLDALAHTVAQGRKSAGQDAAVVFSAHSLPRRMIEQGDPYAAQIEATVAGVVARLQIKRWFLGYQSRSGPVRWLEPEILSLLDELLARGEKKLVLVPVSFVSDHIETLHEMDIRMRDHCLTRGCTTFVRAPALNDDPRFIAALASLVTAATGPCSLLGSLLEEH